VINKSNRLKSKSLLSSNLSLAKTNDVTDPIIEQLKQDFTALETR